MISVWKRFSEWDERRWHKHGLKRWERTRLKGKSGVILTMGFVLFVIRIIIEFVFQWIDGKGLSIPDRFVVNIVSSFIGGCIGGWIMWNHTEKMYKRSKESEKAASKDKS